MAKEGFWTTLFGVILLGLLILHTSCSDYTCNRFDPGPHLRVGMFNDTSVTTFRHGTVITFECDKGFALQGTTLSECLHGQWKGNLPTCKAYPQCPEPSIEFGHYLGGCCSPGARATFYCDDDNEFYLQGARTTMCLWTGVWSEPFPTCKRRGCSIFEPQPHLYVSEFHGTNASFFRDGTVITYGCETGYTLSGPSSSLCAEGEWLDRTQKCERELWVMSSKNDTWAQNGQACKKFSPEPPLFVKEFQGTNASVFYEGTVINYGCEIGFVLFGQRSSRCTEGVWTGRTQTCERRTCTRFETERPLYVNEFQATSSSAFPDGTFITYRCEAGYVLFGPRSSFCDRGVWLGRTQKCIQAKCEMVEAPQNGFMNVTNSTALGMEATFGCNTGYQLEGSAERKCFEGQWDGTPARCQHKGTSGAGSAELYMCPDPGIPDNGFLRTQGPFEPGRNVYFGCNTGYFMHGEWGMQCTGFLGGGGIPHWPSAVPKCKRPYYFDRVENVRVNIDRITSFRVDPGDEEFVYLAFDNLSTVGPENFRHVIGLAHAIATKLFVSSRRYNVGIITFGTNVTVVLDPKENASLDVARERLDRVPYTYGTAASMEFTIGTTWRHSTPVKIERGLYRVFTLLYGKGRFYDNPWWPRQEPGFYFHADRTLHIGIRGDSELTGVYSVRDIARWGEKFMLRDYDDMKLLSEVITDGLGCSRFETKPYLYVKEFQVSNTSVFRNGTTITFGCETGYVLFGPRAALCKNGIWLGRTQQCKRYNGSGDENLQCPPNGTRSSAPLHCISPYHVDNIEVVHENIERLLNIVPNEGNGEFVYIAFDHLSTIGIDNFRHIINLAKAITTQVFAHPVPYHVGIITFGTNVTIVVDPMERISLNATLERLDHVPYTYGSAAQTKMLLGLKWDAFPHIATPMTIERGPYRLFSVIYGAGSRHPHSSPSVPSPLYFVKLQRLSIGIRGDSDDAAVRLVPQIAAWGETFMLRDYNDVGLLAEAISQGTFRRDSINNAELGS